MIKNFIQTIITATLFEADINLLISNTIKYYGNESTEAELAMKLQTVYAFESATLYDDLEEICHSESEELSGLEKILRSNKELQQLEQSASRCAGDIQFTSRRMSSLYTSMESHKNESQLDQHRKPTMLDDCESFVLPTNENLRKRLGPPSSTRILKNSRQCPSSTSSAAQSDDTLSSSNNSEKYLPIEHLIVGTCHDLEKPFFRLNEAPKSYKIRSEKILRLALANIKAKWTENRRYSYACEQFKSIRQDLVVS